MRDEDHSPALGRAADGAVEQVWSHASVHGAERVVEQKHGSLAVQRSGQTHSLPLAAAQVSSSLSYLQQIVHFSHSIKHTASVQLDTNVTMHHKTSHKGLFISIEIVTQYS